MLGQLALATCSTCRRLLLWRDGQLICAYANCPGHRPETERTGA
jgi:hypothetical protein